MTVDMYGYHLELNDSVYAPSEDTFLLFETLKEELGESLSEYSVEYKNYEKVKSKALELGCGTGLISLLLAEYFDVTAVDINPSAVKLTQMNARLNNMKMEVFQSDLFDQVPCGSKDIIVFNPPYVPIESLSDTQQDITVYQRGDDKKDIDIDGGIKGREIIDRFLAHVNNHLTDNGVFYLLVSSNNDIDDLFRFSSSKNINLSIISKRALFFEVLYVIKGTKCLPIRREL